jgi:hypothetical protein
LINRKKSKVEDIVDSASFNHYEEHKDVSYSEDDESKDPIDFVNKALKKGK